MMKKLVASLMLALTMSASVLAQDGEFTIVRNEIMVINNYDLLYNDYVTQAPDQCLPTNLCFVANMLGYEKASLEDMVANATYNYFNSGTKYFIEKFEIPVTKLYTFPSKEEVIKGLQENKVFSFRVKANKYYKIGNFDNSEGHMVSIVGYDRAFDIFYLLDTNEDFLIPFSYEFIENCVDTPFTLEIPECEH